MRVQEKHIYYTWTSQLKKSVYRNSKSATIYKLSYAMYTNFATFCEERKFFKLQKMFISSLYAKIIPKVLKTYNTVIFCIVHYICNH